MSIKPILLNTEMVRAILDRRKTVTRRAVKYKYSNTEMKMKTDKYGTRLIEIQKDVEGETHGKNPDGSSWQKLLAYIEPRPPYRPGDILYVRETWSEWTDGYLYKAWTGPFPQAGQSAIMKWRPSIHMPKEAARIWLKVTDVRVERLQDMNAGDAILEGISMHDLMNPRSIFDEFQKVWNSTIKKSELDRYGWEADPFVWVISFERCEKPEEKNA
jgi:hypothetical protein